MKRFAILIVLSLLLVGMMGVSASNNVYVDGTYEAVSDATDRGYMKAEVTIENDAIVGVTLTGYDGLGLEKTEEYPWAPFHAMLEELPELYVERDHWDVDLITANTSSSIQSNQAVYRALARARVEPTNQKNEFFDGTFMAVSDATNRGWTIVWVSIRNDQITDVVIHETQKDNDDWVRKGEDYGWDEYHEALEVLPERMIEANSPQVDIVTEATGTSERAIQAAERALDWARRN